MKKILVLALTAAALAACAAGSDSIAKLSRNDLSTMTANDVTAYYKDSNSALLDKLVFDNGSRNYDKYVNIFDAMNDELNSMSTVKMTKEDYYNKLNAVVEKHNAQIKKLK